MSPERKVPVVSTTTRLEKRTPSSVTTPATRSPSNRRSFTACWNKVKLAWFSSRDRIARLYRRRSACARVARTAGPLEEFRMRNWIPASSVAIAMAPPKASTSLTRCPFPMPPIDGLQDICPSVSILWVSRRIRQPARAAASAASVPAWPPPTTITSNWEGNCIALGKKIDRNRSNSKGFPRGETVFHVELQASREDSANRGTRGSKLMGGPGVSSETSGFLHGPSTGIAQLVSLQRYRLLTGSTPDIYSGRGSAVIEISL